jgi:hypothetical protein
MAVAVGDLGQWAVGQLAPNWELSLARDSRVFDLSGVTTGQLSLIIYNSVKAQIGMGTGTFVINNVKPGVVTYIQSSADMANAGTFYLRLKVNFNGTSPDFSDYIRIQINA